MSIAGTVEEAVEESAEEQLAAMGVKLEDVLAELHYRRMKKAAEAYRVQALAAKANGERRTIHTRQGGGEVEMQIHPVFYHYWGQRLGYACWSDPQFKREILRDNPSVRIKNHAKAGLETIGMSRNRAVPLPGAPGPGFVPGSAKQTRANQPRTGVHGKRGRWAA